MSKIQFLAATQLPTVYGIFNFQVIKNQEEKKDHILLTYGEFTQEKNPLIRIHSKCLTSECFLSLKCDCREQLHHAMKLIKKQGAGMIIYLNEEGRGIGLVNKIKAYHLQEQGLDTLQANLALGLPGDKRNYQIAIDVLNHFEMKNIRLISNNPDKISALIENNITVIERVPSLMKTNRYNKKYLQTKKEKFGHLL